jgi:hypothetical protein
MPEGILVADKRAEMFVALREWMRGGGCIEDDEELRDQLLSIEYHFTKKQEIRLMSKEDMRSIGRDSPDWGDALALTFAYPVSKRLEASRGGHGRMAPASDPLSYEKLTESEAKPRPPRIYSQFGDNPERFR